MTFVTRVLVVASVTATSEELLAALASRGERGLAKFHLLMPASGTGFKGREAQQPLLEHTLEQWRAAGLDADGEVGDKDPILAVSETWDPRQFDEVVVSTLGGDASKWMQLDLPHRVARITDAQVSHVVAKPRVVGKDDFRPVPKPEPKPLGGLGVAYSWAAGGNRAA